MTKKLELMMIECAERYKRECAKNMKKEAHPHDALKIDATSRPQKFQQSLLESSSMQVLQ